MKIRLISDIHWEKDASKMEFFIPPELPDDSDTVLILPGDLFNGTLSLGIITSFRERFKAILIVFGNHDHWDTGLNITDNILKYKKAIEFFGLDNVHLLDGDTIEIDGYLFVGATLWSDMKNGDPMIVELSKRYMYEYKFIKNFSPRRWLMESSRDFIMINEAVKKNLKTVVITHFAPCELSITARFKGLDANYFFYTDYSEYIMDNPNIALWVHGHVHSSHDYILGQTRVVSNPRGYSIEENPDFDPNLTIILE